MVTFRSGDGPTLDTATPGQLAACWSELQPTVAAAVAAGERFQAMPAWRRRRLTMMLAALGRPHFADGATWSSPDEARAARRVARVLNHVAVRVDAALNAACLALFAFAAERRQRVSQAPTDADPAALASTLIASAGAPSFAS